MRRAFKRGAFGVLAVAAVLVILLAGVWTAGNADWGRREIERLTARLTGGSVLLTGLGGSFPADLTLENLRLRDAQGVWLDAQHIAVRWSPLALLRGRIQVDALQVGRVHMERTPVSDGKPGGSVSIPSIEVGRFHADRLELGAPLVGTPASVTAEGHLQLRALDDAAGDVSVRRLNGEGDYALHLRLDPQHLDASLAAHEPAGGPLENLLTLPGLGALSATVTVQGPRNAEHIDAVVDAGSLHAQVRGQIDLPHAAADLAYSLESPALAPRPEVGWDRLMLKGDWHGPLQAPQAKGVLDVAGLRLAGDTRIAHLHADLEAHGGVLGMRAVAEGLQTPGPEPRLFAAAPVALDATLALAEPARPLVVTVRHPLINLRASADTADFARGQRVKVQLNVPELAPFAALASEDLHGRAVVDATFTHDPAQSSLTLEATLDPTGGNSPVARVLGSHAVLALAASMTDDGVKVQSLKFSANGADLSASGTAARVAGTATAAASIKDLQVRWQLGVAELHALVPDLAGEVRASGQLSGSPAALGIDAEAASQLSVRGSPSGTVDAVLHLRGLPKAPSGTIEAHGSLDGAPLNLDATLERADSKEIRVQVRQANWKSAHLDGDLSADAELGESRGQLRLKIADLADFDRLLGTSVAGSVDGSLGFRPTRGHSEALLDLDVRHLIVGGVAGDVHLHAAGPVDAVELQLNAQLPQLHGAAAKASAAATLDLDARTLRLASLTLEYRGGTLHALAPAQLSFAAGLAVDDLKLGLQNAVFAASGQLLPTLDLRASLEHVDAGVVNLFSPQLLAAGTLDASARLQGSLASPSGAVRLDVSGLQFADDAATGLPPVEIHGRAQLANDAATVRASLAAGSGSRITATGSAPLRADGALDLKIGGKLDTGLANPLLEARGLRASGTLVVDASVTGSSSAPTVGGGITLSGGTLRDYVRGVNLSAINADVVGTDGGLQIKTLTARAGTGDVTVTGTLGVLQHDWPADLTITAKNAQPIASSIVTAVLDADLHLAGTALEHLDFTGTIHVDRATIGIPDSLPPEIAVLDVRRRGQAVPTVGAQQLVIGLDVAIHAANEILVEGRGLDAELGGNIKITGTTDAPQVSGGFTLQRGSFTISGNKLSLVPPGGVSFDGAGLRRKIDPTLDFTAQTTVSDYQITMLITGMADQPQFSLKSQPDLPPDQIMSLLLFSMPAAQLSALQVAEVGAALATLTGVGSGGSNPLTRLQKTLGLDRLTVASNTTTTATGATENSGAAIAAGRYVTKRVYVEGKQTTAGTSQVQVDVDLTKHLRLQTQLGNGTATTQGTTPDNDPGSVIGLSYHFEY